MKPVGVTLDGVTRDAVGQINKYCLIQNGLLLGVLIIKVSLADKGLVVFFQRPN